MARSMSAIRCKEPYGRGPSSAAAAASLSLSSGSHAIAKTHRQQQPKIRIVHIFAPKIIKTEAHNFRALVQRLTGKPQQTAGRSDHLLRRRINDAEKEQKTACELPPRNAGADPDSEPGAEDRVGREQIKIDPWVKEDEEREVETKAMMKMTSSSGSSDMGSNSISSSGSLLEVLGDLELGFLHGSCDLPWPPPLMLHMASSSSSQVDV